MGDSLPKKDCESENVPLSPVDLFTHKTKLMVNESFQFVAFNKEHKADVVNTGRTVQLTFKGEPANRPRVSGGGLPYPDYYMRHVHFKWDAEHTINNVRFPLEAHMVLQAFDHKDWEVAARNNAIAVLAVHFQYGIHANAALRKVAEVIPRVATKPKIPLKDGVSFVVGQLLPENTNNYFRYQGTMTFEPYEKCTWSVFVGRRTATREQVFHLSSIRNNVEEPIVHNNLLAVNIEGQQVYFNGDKYQCKCLKL